MAIYGRGSESGHPRSPVFIATSFINKDSRRRTAQSFLVWTSEKSRRGGREKVGTPLNRLVDSGQIGEVSFTYGYLRRSNRTRLRTRIQADALFSLP